MNPEQKLILAPDLAPSQADEILSRYKFKDTAKADKILQALAEEPHLRRLFAEIVADLLDKISKSPDPDLALVNFERFASATFDRSAFYSLLKAMPPLIEILATMFGSSHYLSDILVRNPEYLSWIIDSRVMDSPKSKEQMLSELSKSVSLFPDIDGKLAAMRRYKRRETLRLGLRDLLGEADQLGLKKSGNKTANVFEAHAVDSWVLASSEVGGEVVVGVPDGI